MTYLPFTILPVYPTITPASINSIGLILEKDALSAPGSSLYPSANRAYYVPFTLNQTVIVTKLFSVNGATAANNFDIGIYADDGTKIISTGSTAQSGTNTIQAVDITDTILGPGRFYMAYAANGTSLTVFAWNTIVGLDQPTAGIFIQASAFALPASATFATSASTVIPLFGLLLAPTTII